MARAALRLLRQPHFADLEDILARDLSSITAAIKEESEIVRQAFEKEQEREEKDAVSLDKESNHRIGDRGFTPELLRIITDILKERGVIESEEPERVEGAGQKPDSEESTLSAGLESVQLNVKNDSDDEKGWLRDDDSDDNEEEEVVLRHFRRIYLRDAPRNSSRRSPFRRRRHSNLDTYPRERSKSPDNIKEVVHPGDLWVVHQRRSVVRPFSSQPVTAREIASTASQQSPGRRPHPNRKSVTMPHTYNVKTIFKNQAGSLYGPEHRLV